MDQAYQKTGGLPQGTWLMVKRLPAGVSDQDVRQYFAAFGFDIPVEWISVRHFPNGASALVSMPGTVVAKLVNGITQEAPFYENGVGWNVKVEGWQRNKPR